MGKEYVTTKHYCKMFLMKHSEEWLRYVFPDKAMEGKTYTCSYCFKDVVIKFE